MAEVRTLDLEKLLTGGQLPGLPQSAINLLQLSKDPKAGPGDFAKPIEADPGLTSQVLRFVNSSYFGFSREIAGVRQAVQLVGIRTVKNFALWSAVFSLMPNPKCGPFDLKCLWQDSLRRALFAKVVANLLGLKDGEDAFVAALLQDMAVPILAKAYPGEYEKLLEARDNGKRRLSDLERERFGMTHAEAAGRMARHWNLPEGTSQLMEKHATLSELLPGAARPEQLAVALSALLPACRDEAWPEFALFEERYQKLMPAEPTAVELLRRIDEDFAGMAPILKIALPKKTLAESYDEARCVPA
jgi:HD-like signal output (HDOD) protein